MTSSVPSRHWYRPQVDATVERTLAKQFGVKGYPALKWFINGELHADYDGPRDS